MIFSFGLLFWASAFSAASWFGSSTTPPSAPLRKIPLAKPSKPTADKIDFTTFDSSATSTSGKIKIGPLLIQWGRASATISSASGPAEGDWNVTFDEAYAYAPVVMAVPQDQGGIVAEYVVLFETTKTKASGALGRAASGETGTSYLRWLAVGLATS